MTKHGHINLVRLAFGGFNETVLSSRLDIPIVVVRAMISTEWGNQHSHHDWQYRQFLLRSGQFPASVNLVDFER